MELQPEITPVRWLPGTNDTESRLITAENRLTRATGLYEVQGQGRKQVGQMAHLHPLVN
jgi:hypothetical protein